MSYAAGVAPLRQGTRSLLPDAAPPLQQLKLSCPVARPQRRRRMSILQASATPTTNECASGGNQSRRLPTLRCHFPCTKYTNVDRFSTISNPVGFIDVARRTPCIPLRRTSLLRAAFQPSALGRNLRSSHPEEHSARARLLRTPAPRILPSSRFCGRHHRGRLPGAGHLHRHEHRPDRPLHCCSLHLAKGLL